MRVSRETGVQRGEPAVLHLSSVLGGRLEIPGGGRVGRVEDVIVRLGDAGYPPITGFLVTVARRRSFLASEGAADVAPGRVLMSTAKLDLGEFSRRPEEILLARDVLDRQLINVDGARLVRANEIELARVGGWWRVVGVDTGPRGALRRLLPWRLAKRVGTGPFLDWASVEPFVGHVPSLRLRVPHPRLARLHPAQIADLVEAASHHEGEEILRAVRGFDDDLEAGVFEELDAQHRIEFLARRSDADLAAVLSRMAPDDAADLASELDDQRREQVLDRLPPRSQAKVRVLLGYDRASAGGLMSPDFVCMYRQATAEEAIERIRRSRIPDEQLTDLFVMDAGHRLTGAVRVAALLRAEPQATLAELSGPGFQRLSSDAGLEEVARVMADYNLTSVPVVDAKERMIGVLTVDDVLEAVMPRSWRRRFAVWGPA